MRIEVLLIVDVKHVGPEPLEVLQRALQRRGWFPSADGTFRIALETEASDEQVVKYVDRDVKEAEYVAGLQNLESVCILNSGESKPSSRQDLQTTGSDVNLI